MKLLELDASFRGWAPGGLRKIEAFAEAHGVLFLCPRCQDHYILVWFKDRGVPAEATPSHRWSASGTCLDDLTLSPSINLDVPGTSGCKWHGFVRGGDAS